MGGYCGAGMGEATESVLACAAAVLQAVGLDVTVEVELHFVFSFEGGTPPGGGVVKSHGYSGLAI
jgi:hypothetical protein